MDKLSRNDRILLEKAIKARAVKDQKAANKSGRGQDFIPGPVSPVNTIRALKIIQTGGGSSHGDTFI